MSASEHTEFRLPESAIPTHWVNLLPDLPGEGLPPLHPGTKQPLAPEDLAPLFPMALIEQEVSAEPEIEIRRLPQRRAHRPRVQRGRHGGGARPAPRGAGPGLTPGRAAPVSSGRPDR